MPSFRLPVPTPHSFTEVTLNLEKILSWLGQNFLQLAAATAGVKVAFGPGTLAWPGGSPLTATATIAHGLGTTPKFLGAIADLTPGAVPCLVSYVAADGTNVQWRGYAADDSSPAAAVLKSFYWVAIG